jgi:O-antigen ligase
VILLIAFLLASRGTRRSMFAGLIAMSVLVASAGVVTSLGETGELERPRVLSRYELLLQTNRGGSVSVREDMYAIAIDQFTPLGYGMGTWPLLVDGMDHESYPHNIFLELLFEQGVPGLLVFLGFLFIVSTYSLRYIRLAPSRHLKVFTIVGYTSFVYSMMVAQTSGDLYDNRMIWLFAGIVLVTIVLCHESQREEGGLSNSKSGEQ